MITSEAGGSLILGTLSSQMYIQKFNERGLSLWPDQVLLHYNDSTDNTGGSGLISDGSGGAIVFWNDHRGATQDQNGYLNNSIFMQRVDGNGIVRWQSGGVLLAPAPTGVKGAIAVSDANGGAVLVVNERDFDHPGANNIERLWAARFNSSGQEQWRMQYDSSTIRSAILLYGVVRIGSMVYIQSSLGIRVINLAGVTQASPFSSRMGTIISEGDSVGYHLESIGTRLDSIGKQYFVGKVTHISTTGDTIWSSRFEIEDEAGNAGYSTVTNPLLPDGLGGVFYVWSFIDQNNVSRNRAQWITPLGAQWPNGGLDIPEQIAPFCFAAKGELGIYFRSGHAQKFDTAGFELWPTSFTVISDVNDAYSTTLGSDHNGGAILCFWRITGGIWAIHTGRNGSVGVISSVNNSHEDARTFLLSQNYPNPFNPVTKISYTLPKASHVRLKVYNILGEQVASLVDGYVQSGTWSEEFDGSQLPSGMYFYRLTAGEFVEVKKMVLVK